MLRRRADGQGDAERDGSKKEDIEEEAAATNEVRNEREALIGY